MRVRKIWLVKQANYVASLAIAAFRRKKDANRYIAAHMFDLHDSWLELEECKYYE